MSRSVRSAQLVALTVILVLGVFAIPGTSASVSLGHAPSGLAPTGSALRAAQWFPPLNGSSACNASPPLTFAFTLSPFNVTTGLSTGPIPFTVTINATARGGHPPDEVTWTFGDGSASLRNDGTGTFTHTYSYPGVFEVSALGHENATGEGFGEGLEVQTWGSSGPDPVNIAVNRTSGPVPLSVSYSANVTGLPFGATYDWVQGGGSFPHSSSTSVLNETYDAPGDAWVYLYVVYPNGSFYGLGGSPVVVIDPLVNLTVAASATLGASPLPVTFWGNVSNISGTPYSGTYRVDWDFGDVGPNGTDYNETGVVVNHTYSSTGEEVPATASVVAPNGIVLATAAIEIQVTWNGTHQFPVPILSLSASPSNGSSPLVVNISTYGFGGVLPFSLTVVAFGPETTTGYGACSVIAESTSWDGSRLDWNRTFNVSGDYRILAEMTDSSGASNIFDQAFAPFTVVAPPAIPPLVVQAAKTATGGSGNSTASFIALVSGGVPPYTLQWGFGDGTFGSSLPGETIHHTYLTPGSFTPTLTVTDHRGTQTLSTLAQIVVTGGSGPISPPPGLTPLGTAVGSGAVFLLVLIGVPTVALTVGHLVSKRTARRQEGLRWVQTLESGCAPGEDPPRNQ